MSESLTVIGHQEPERRYDEQSDRLFLVYYALPPGFNANKWGVSPRSLDANIQSAVGKPVVVLRKNPNNPFHSKQAGMYIHPTPEEASSELQGRITEEQYYNWQEKFAIGRVKAVDKRAKGYAWTLEITDPEVKNILKSDTYRDGIPGWTSPQILSNGLLYPEESKSELYDHYSIAHVALVDVPAYGFDQAGRKGKCFGAEKECMIQTRSASQENLDFCVKQAAIDLINSVSSQSSQVANSSHNTMSESTSAISTEPKISTNSDNVTITPAAVNTIPTISDQPTPGQEKPEGQQDDNKPEEQQSVKSIEEANVQIKQMSELLKEQAKQLKAQGKELEQIKTERKMARLSFIIPRDLFKSDESHRKEVERTMNENVSEAWLTEYWKTKRELAIATTGKRMEEPLTAKSASVQNGHDVPDFSSSQNTAQTSNIQKQLELQRRIIEGGGSSY